MGNIGKKVAKRANAFNFKILYHNRNRLNNKDETRLNVCYSPLNHLLNVSKSGLNGNKARKLLWLERDPLCTKHSSSPVE